MKLGLGTVQFGLNYGISNPDGQTSGKEVAKILTVAQQFNVRVIDTAALYGSSEEVLGNALPADHEFKLVTKTVRFDTNRITPATTSLLEKTFVSSLQKLRCSSVYGLMIHNVADVLAKEGHLLMDSLTGLKQSGLVKKIGVSVYTAEQIEMVLDRFEIDLIQLPINVLDQRLLQGGQLAKLKTAGVEIHARSAFLQGLLLMEPETLPDYFAPVRQHLKRYHDILREQRISPVQAALGFLAAYDEIDAIVCGVNNHLQLIELCQASEPLTNVEFSEFAFDNDAILDPSQWRSI